jgi:uncharacterized Tic20 family protein
MGGFFCWLPIILRSEFLMSPDPLSPSDRKLAALGHLSILLPGLGLLAPLILWAVGRERSEELRFQILQAGALQVLQPLAALLATLILVLVELGILLAHGLVESLRRGDAGQANALLWPNAIYAGGLYALVGLVFIVFGVLAAAACWQGKAYRYPWLGDKLAAYLNLLPGQAREHEQNWLAGLCHLGLFAGLSGLIGCFVVSAACRKDEDSFLRFQSLQAGIYQIVGLVVGFLTWGIAALLIGLSGASLALASGEFSGLPGLITAVLGLLALLCAGVYALAVPVYQTLPVVAAVRFLQERDYLYPIIGTWLSKRSTILYVRRMK